MSLRTLAFLFGLATALFAQMAVALGLGEIKLNSALNQPLDAEIQLLQVRDLSEQEILAGLASADDFQRVGIDRPFFLSQLEFTVDMDDPDNPLVRVTSEQPVREPFLNFLVEIQWPSGRLLREYTLLMDLPVYARDQQAQPVEPANTPSTTPSATPSTATRPGQPVEQRQVRETQTPRAPEREAVTTDTSGATTYGVKAADNLWNIAKAMRPDRGVSIQQAMLAIQRANPGAFINDNINLLRQGQVLRIPNREEMTKLSAREAIAEVAYQNQRWSGRAETVAERPQLEGSRSYSQAETESDELEGRVKLTSPQDYADSSEGRGTGAGEGSTEALENKLAGTLEELDKTRSENQELKSRLEALESQIETMERLLEVSSEEMRALQLSAQRQQDADEAAGAAPAEDAAPTETPAVENPVAESTEEVADALETAAPGGADPEQPQTPAQDSAAAPARPETPKAQSGQDPSRVVRTEPKPGNQWLDLVLDNLLFIALGLVALLAALAVYLRSRKKSNEEGFDEFVTEPEADEDWAGAEGAMASRDGEFDFLDLEQDAEEFAPAEAEQEEMAEQETEDAVAEAEIYIALGKNDQAEDILLRALEKEPQDADIRLKLLEFYATQQDIDNFDPQYAQLRALGDKRATARAKELRAQIAGALPFDESRFEPGEVATKAAAAGVVADEQHGLDEDLSFDLDLDSFEDEQTTTEPESTDSLNDFDLELDLDHELEDATGGADKADTVTRDVADSNESDDLDFDFELDIDEAPATDNDTADNEEQASELDLEDEFEFDLGLEDVGDTADEAVGVDMEKEAEADLDDLAAEDFDFSAAFDESAMDEETASDVDTGEISLDLNDELEADLASGSSEDETDTEDFSLGDLDDTIETLGLDEEEPEILEDTVEEDLEASFTSEGSEEDELNIDTDMDLSALDEELDAMTAGLDTELSEDVLEEEAPVREQGSAVEPESESEPGPADAPLSEFDFDLGDIDPESEDDSDLGFLSDSDETATKLDLARAYMDMGDADGAKDILEEIIQEGNDEQRKEAQSLLERV